MRSNLFLVVHKHPITSPVSVVLDSNRFQVGQPYSPFRGPQYFLRFSGPRYLLYNMLCRLYLVELEVGSGRLKGENNKALMSLLGPDFALINPKMVCGSLHLSQASYLADKAHEGKYNFTKDRSTELLLYLTAQRQISRAIEVAGIKPSSEAVAWVSFSQVPDKLADLIEPDDSVISHLDFDYSSLGLDKTLLDKLSFDEKQKIVMTRTAALPVQSR